MLRPHHRPDRDRLGFDETTNYVTRALSRLVPDWIARRAVTVSVDTSKTLYRPGEPVDIVVEFQNRLPVPVSVPTVERRLWEWRVDGVLEATDEPRYVDRSPGSFEFRGGERKRIVHRWNGRFRRREGVDGLPTSEPAAPGEHTIGVSLATSEPDERSTDSTTITVR